MVIMMVVVMLFPLSFLSHGRGVKLVDPYLGGANLQGGPSFAGAAGEVENVTLHNYYMTSIINEILLTRVAGLCAVGLLLAMFASALL